MTTFDDQKRADPAPPRSAKKRMVSQAGNAEPVPAWMSELERRAGRPQRKASPLARVFGGEEKQVRFQIHVRESRLRDALVIDLWCRADDNDAWRPLDAAPGALPSDVTEHDRQLLAQLLGNRREAANRPGFAEEPCQRVEVQAHLIDTIVPLLCASGRLVSEGKRPGVVTPPLVFDRGEPYRFELAVSLRDEFNYRLSGRLYRDDERLSARVPLLALSSGVLVFEDRVARAELQNGFDWLSRIRRQGEVDFPAEAKDRFVVHLSQLPDVPEISLPPEMHWSQVSLPPRPRVCFIKPDPERPSPYVVGKVAFDYGGRVVSVGSQRSVAADSGARKLFRRDKAAERKALTHLRALGLDEATAEERSAGEVRVQGSLLYEVVRTLVEEGWFIEADGGEVRTPTSKLKAKVTSGIDWFDLDGEVDYGGSKARLPALLAAAQGGFVELEDGSRGLAPDWLSQYKALARSARDQDGKLRFLPSQAGIIDALLTGHEDATVDVKFERLRKVMSAAPPPVQEPEGFCGTLRDYQRQGVAWLRFLEQHHYAGCLADDMGLGKTVQVLAMLQGRHRPRGKRPSSHTPSLIVVPCSLVGNWLRESQKFTPDLKGVAYTGAARKKLRGNLKEYDFVVTTYGTLRQDILELLETRFNTVILDEAQAIKNPRSQAAKACRLLRSHHRLAITGTPIENSLDELWSIFEFLNPGMLGPLEDFAGKDREYEDEELALYAAALRPFMLRRTKEEVLKELPQKTELVLSVELEGKERDRYHELRDFYRNKLAGHIEAEGLAKSKIHVLEALLRLRQAACHPGLIDPTKKDEPSAKIDILFDKLEEVVSTGHKALVFSQFTTLLDIVRRRLQAKDIKHEYLDGSTHDRQGLVERFQEDESNKVFLISLKAGGCGLTLTSADYVFILDPWWNPAVEAQAIDRAHRMGQQRPVFAYRLIAKDTVEEKIVKLQAEKRKLADAIISGNGRVLSKLSEDDLERIFG